MHKIENIKQEKKYWKILVSLPRFEPGSSSTIQHQSYFQKRLVFQQRQHESFKQINPSKTKTCLFTMQYTKSYGCAVLFLQDILLFDLTFLKETCFDTVKHFVVFYILH